MRILKVIHGYPMRYNAGSEVYSQTLCQALANRHEVHVFTREENPFAPPYDLKADADPDDTRVRLHVVNMANFKDRYRHEMVDQRFLEVLEDVRPDVVHIGHLNHLSTSLIARAAAANVPIVFTLHDYWLMCPRGQFMQMFPEDPTNLWAACEGQEDRKCAQRCYARYFSGDPETQDHDVQVWSDWVNRRMTHVREMAELVDMFVAPARYLRDRFVQDFGLPAEKVKYLDYGFDLSRFVQRKRDPCQPFTFGYIGTHIPAKGIHHLIQAFGQLSGAPILRIWGRPRGQETDALRVLAGSLPGDACDRVEWYPEYRNQDIVTDVFNQVDAIVVSSVWAENSPLVIHEAQQCRVPVVTANYGGMGEYVHHEVNGLLFEHRNPEDLARQMQRLVDDPELAVRLGRRGYPFDDNGDIPSVEDHVVQIEAIYDDLVAMRDRESLVKASAPWRITFDTNPDDCNLSCIMCEEHSTFSSLQKRRRAEGRPRRRMEMAMIRQVVEETAGRGLREIIPSTMGEPLLFKDFDQIIDLCHEFGIKLNLTTNGTFPGRGVRAWAERLVAVTSDIKISWNGATAATHETIMPGIKWEQALANARTFIAIRDAHAAAGGNRCRVTFQLTFLESNVGELADMVRLAVGLGVDRLKGHHLWAHFSEIEDLSMRRSPESIERWNEAVREAHSVARANPLPNGELIQLDNIFELDAAAVTDLAPSGVCPFLGQEAWISAQGRFDPCCAPDAQRRTLGEFGNLHEQSFTDIWNSEPYRNLTQGYSSKALCVGCNMRRPGDQ
ncbi:glycosyltransferase [Rhodoferax fermentans]|uniref:Radical SAM protein n=1 Tax=Rhodoferax fermentans TaxID=28066 RepID=A0A1T1AU21_RHOFE|nr:glycosyltransferase [Rhodoferax fermentans]MBK1684988.1 radical SAM protein [Rhodoferax fermentans]OOV07448.1 radical SAM protein [Rhodoferax fermentans]